MSYHYITAWHQPNKVLMSQGKTTVFSPFLPLTRTHGYGLAYKLFLEHLPAWLTGYVAVHQKRSRDPAYYLKDWLA